MQIIGGFLGLFLVISIYYCIFKTYSYSKHIQEIETKLDDLNANNLALSEQIILLLSKKDEK